MLGVVARAGVHLLLLAHARAVPPLLLGLRLSRLHLEELRLHVLQRLLYRCARPRVVLQRARVLLLDPLRVLRTIC